MKDFGGWLMTMCLAMVTAWWIIITYVPSPIEARTHRYIDVTVTVAAYCPCRRCCGPRADGRTADNRRIRKADYTIAVSRDIEAMLPMGHSVDVAGYGRAVVRDRTHAKRWRQIEVLMTVWKNGKSPHRRALEWGVKRRTIRIRRRTP